MWASVTDRSNFEDVMPVRMLLFALERDCSTLDTRFRFAASSSLDHSDSGHLTAEWLTSYSSC